MVINWIVWQPDTDSDRQIFVAGFRMHSDAESFVDAHPECQLSSKDFWVADGGEL